MLPQSRFIAFDDIKFKNFSNRLSDSSVYVISCIRQPHAQELDKIQVLGYMHASFVDLLLESVSQRKVATRLRLNVCWCALYSLCRLKYEHNYSEKDAPEKGTFCG